MRLRGRHYRTGQLLDVVSSDGLITQVGPPSSARADAEGALLAPALFDLQINGSGGHSFASLNLTIDQVHSIVADCRRHGISGLAPTLITDSFDAIHHGFTTLGRACEQDRLLSRAIPVFHLEGPYISPVDGPRGAHPLPHVRPPNDDEFHRWQDAAGGRIRLLTLAPEWPGACAFIERRVREGVVIALAHTAATSAQIRDAVRAGAKLSTHLGNGSHALLPRHENYFFEQLACDDLMASIIADGHHVPDALLRCILRVKGPKRLIVTCDASTLAGLPSGRYREWGADLEILPGGKIVVVGTPNLAGSGLFLDDCVAKLASLGELTNADILDMAGAAPRALLGLPAVEMKPGEPADVLVYDDTLRPVSPNLL